MIERYQAFTEQQRSAYNTRSYALTLEHKHLPEMMHYSSTKTLPVFSPSVGHYYQGMLTHVPLHRSQLSGLHDAQQLVDVLQNTYQDEPFVTVHPLQAPGADQDGFLDATSCNNTNRIELMVFASQNRFLLVARYDNLGKGAAGCAVQNLNLMLGEAETTGLQANLST